MPPVLPSLTINPAEIGVFGLVIFYLVEFLKELFNWDKEDKQNAKRKRVAAMLLGLTGSALYTFARSGLHPENIGFLLFQAGINGVIYGGSALGAHAITTAAKNINGPKEGAPLLDTPAGGGDDLLTAAAEASGTITQDPPLIELPAVSPVDPASSSVAEATTNLLDNPAVKEFLKSIARKGGNP